MSPRVKKLLAEAAALLPEERAELARALGATAMNDSSRARGRRFGSARGRVHIAADFDEPLADFADYS